MARTGFGASLLPKDRIKNLIKNTPLLKKDSIEESVFNQRRVWDADYGNRGHNFKFFTEEKLFTPNESSVTDTSTMKINPSHSVKSVDFHAESGFWALMLTTHKDGRKDWQLSVDAGNCLVWHPGEGQNIILAHHSEDVYRQWKRTVMSTFKADTDWLLTQARKTLRGETRWSITSCDRSSALVSQIPRVSVLHPGVGFLHL